MIRDKDDRLISLNLKMIYGKEVFDYGLLYTKDFNTIFNTKFQIHCGSSLLLNDLLKEIDFPLDSKDNLYFFLYTLPQIPKDLDIQKELSFGQKYRQFTGFSTSNPFIKVGNSVGTLETSVDVSEEFGDDAAFTNPSGNKINISTKNEDVYFVSNYESRHETAVICFFNGQVLKVNGNNINIIRSRTGNFSLPVPTNQQDQGHLKCLTGEHLNGKVNFSNSRLSQSLYFVDDAPRFEMPLIILAVVLLIMGALAIILKYPVKKTD